MCELRLFKLIIVALFFSLISGCLSGAKQTFSTPHNSYQLAKVNQLTHQQQAQLYEVITSADKASHEKDYLSATSYYLFAASLLHNQQLINNAIESATAAKDPLGLEQAAKIQLKHSPHNKRALILLFESQLVLNNIPDALQTLLSLIKETNSNQEKYQLLTLHILDKEPRISVALLRELKKTFPDDPAIIALQARFILSLYKTSKNPEKILAQSLSSVEEALKHAPLFVAAIRLKMRLLFQMKDEARAQNYLVYLQKENPKSSPINQIIGQYLYDLQNYNQAIRHYLKWLKTHPKDFESHYYLAASFYALEQYALSLTHFQLLHKNNYKPQSTAFYCGNSAQKLSQNKLAIECFNQVTAGKFLSAAKIKQAHLLTLEKNDQQALAILQAPYDLDDKSKTQLIVAEIALLNSHYSNKKAKARLNKALKNYPNNFDLLIKKIDIYQLNKNAKKLKMALIDAQKSLVSEEELTRFDFLAANLLHNNGFYQQSINWLTQAIKKKPKDKDLLYTRSLYREALGQYKQMLVELKHLAKLYPDDFNIKNALGYTLADQNVQLEYAQALIDSSYQTQPNNPAVIDSKGWLAFRKGQLSAAKEYLRRAFKLYPSAETASHLGEVLWMTKEKQAAKSIWKKGIEIDKKNRVLLKTLERLNIELD